MRFRLLLGLVAWAAFWLQPTGLESAPLTSDDGELVLRLPDGHSLKGEALVGLRLISGKENTELRIDGLSTAPEAIWGSLPLYVVSVKDPKAPEAVLLCEADSMGRRAAIAMPDGIGGFSFTCTSGAEGKCILYGYRPWAHYDDLPLQDLFRACVHMHRADYGGDGTPSTRNGIPINFWDRFGVLAADMADGMEFEAAWGPDGAICVAHPRVPEHVSLEELARRYPKLASHLGPESCIDETVVADPRAILFNRSAVKKPPS
ncbi:ADYC domain-containing protein [Microvirga puerhi]|uniref:ADYC domain-containing protein n=1 Tax=Microvirga puerhi TaxID=2876078 RepID=A0ABS7VPT6_9HYPH|nr:ADYC domain-containing protein [Microvirga puerhi]MBZ6077146.1 hypothetical protein [Microvirga puerhi]